MKLVIGLSYAPVDNPKSMRYHHAVETAAKGLGHEIETVDLNASPNRVSEIDGIVFTGGADVDPARYGKMDEEKLCHEIDRARDEHEFALAEAADTRDIPVLGICRGLQLLNVAKGGTLFTDLESFGAANHKKINPQTDSRHEIRVEPGSFLAKLLRTNSGEVNSAHHQGIEQLGDGLVVSARSTTDGTIEAIEKTDPGKSPFFLAVQWHPERMATAELFSGRIFESFVWEVAAQKVLGKRLEKSDRAGEQR